MNDRTQIILLINQAMTAGASKAKACQLICLSERTLQRWQARSDGDARPHRIQTP
jgi:putative transposase